MLRSEISCSDFDYDSSVALNLTETVNEVTLSYTGITSLNFYTLEFRTYAFLTVGREDNTEDSSSIIISCLLFSFSSFIFFPVHFCRQLTILQRQHELTKSITSSFQNFRT